MRARPPARARAPTNQLTPLLRAAGCRRPACDVTRTCVRRSRRYLIIENFIPPEEKNKIMNRLMFDPEEDQWRFQPLAPAERCGSAFDLPP